MCGPALGQPKYLRNRNLYCDPGRWAGWWRWRWRRYISLRMISPSPARTVNYSANLSFPAKKTPESRVDMSGASSPPPHHLPRGGCVQGCCVRYCAPRPAPRPTFTRTMCPAPAVPTATLAWPHVVSCSSLQHCSTLGWCLALQRGVTLTEPPAGCHRNK